MLEPKIKAPEYADSFEKSSLEKYFFVSHLTVVAAPLFPSKSSPVFDNL
jgi:hypothetical protein